MAKQTKQDKGQLQERLTEWYLCLMASVYLLWPGWEGYANITVHKWRLFLVLTGGYVLLCVLLRLELWLVGRAARPAPWKALRTLPLTAKLMLAYLLWTLVSALASPWRSQALLGGGRREGALSIALYVLSFVCVLRHGRPTRRLLTVFAASAGACAALSLVQLLGFNPFGLYPEGMRYQDAFVKYAGAYLGTIGNTDHLAAVLSLAVPILWVALLRLEGRRRFWLLLPLSLCLAVLLWMGVDAGLVALAGSTLLSLPAVLPCGDRTRRRLWLAIPVVLLLGLAGVFFLGGSPGGSLGELSALLHGQVSDSFGSGRVRIWRELAPLVGERPILGGGPETLGLRNDIVFERWHEDLGILLRSTVDDAHNAYYNILLCQGVPGLLLYLAGLVCAARHWLRRAKTSPAAALLGAGVLGYCIQAFFSVSAVIVSPFLWLALGLLVGEETAR